MKTSTPRKHKRLATVLAICLAITLPGCQSSTMEEGGLGATIGAVAGGAIGYAVGDEEGAIIGAIAGGTAGYLIQRAWNKSKANEASRQQLRTQEEVEQEYQEDNAVEDVPEEPELNIVMAKSRINPDVKVVDEGDPLTFRVAYETVGGDAQNLSLCRQDLLGYRDVGEASYALVKEMYNQCDLDKAGENIHETSFTVPPEAQHGIYVLESRVEVHEGTELVAQDLYTFYFAIGDEFEEDVPPNGTVQSYAYHNGEKVLVVAEHD